MPWVFHCLRHNGETLGSISVFWEGDFFSLVNHGNTFSALVSSLDTENPMTKNFLQENLQLDLTCSQYSGIIPREPEKGVQGGGVFIPIAAGFLCVLSVFFGADKVYLGAGEECFSYYREEKLVLQARWSGLSLCTRRSPDSYERVLRSTRHLDEEIMILPCSKCFGLEGGFWHLTAVCSVLAL